MTAIDRTSRGPVLGQTTFTKLIAVADRPEVLAAFIFGSQARGSVDLLSDVDIAIVHEPGLDSHERFRLRLELIDGATEALASSEVDVVLLNDAPALFKERALRDAVVLLDREPGALDDFRRRTLREYAETEAARDELSARLRRRILEGSFGRRP